MSTETVYVERTSNYEGLPDPEYVHASDSGFDLRAAIPYSSLVLEAGAICAVPVGLKVQVPVGYELQVRPRSGLAFKHGVTVLNAPGTVDAGYRGEVQVILHNASKRDFTVERGDRIAQAVLAPVSHAAFHFVDSLDDSERGEAGFGSTGHA